MEGMLWITQAVFQEERTVHGALLDRENPLFVGGRTPMLPLLYPSQGHICP